MPKAMTLREIQAETVQDSTLQSLTKAIGADRWTDSEILEYKILKDELLVYSRVVLRKGRKAEACGTSRHGKDEALK